MTVHFTGAETSAEILTHREGNGSVRARSPAFSRFTNLPVKPWARKIVTFGPSLRGRSGPWGGVPRFAPRLEPAGQRTSMTIPALLARELPRQNETNTLCICLIRGFPRLVCAGQRWCAVKIAKNPALFRPGGLQARKPGVEYAMIQKRHWAYCALS